MNFRDIVAEDPFSTALDRCIAAQYRKVGQHDAAVTAEARKRLGPDLWREVWEYWDAVKDNHFWDALVLRSWDRRLVWDSAAFKWRGETDEEFYLRTAALKWRRVDGRFEFIETNKHERAA